MQLVTDTSFCRCSFLVFFVCIIAGCSDKPSKSVATGASSEVSRQIPARSDEDDGHSDNVIPQSKEMNHDVLATFELPSAELADHPVSDISNSDIQITYDFGGPMLSLPESAKMYLENESRELREALINNLGVESHCVVSHMMLSNLYDPTRSFDKLIGPILEPISMHSFLDLGQFDPWKNGYWVSKDGVIIEEETTNLVNRNLEYIDLQGNVISGFGKEGNDPMFYNGLKFSQDANGELTADPYLCRVFQCRWRTRIEELKK